MFTCVRDKNCLLQESSEICMQLNSKGNAKKYIFKKKEDIRQWRSLNGIIRSFVYNVINVLPGNQV